MDTSTIQVQYITSQEGLRAAMFDVLSELKLIEKPASRDARPPANRPEACGFLGISLSTLDTLLKTGQINHFRIGRQVRINWNDLEAYINKKGDQ